MTFSFFPVREHKSLSEKFSLGRILVRFLLYTIRRCMEAVLAGWMGTI